MLILDPQPNSMVVNLTMDHLPGCSFTLVLPKTIGEQNMSMVNFPAHGLQWSLDSLGNHLGVYDPGVLIRCEIRLTAAHDHLRCAIHLTNLTDFQWQNVWAFTFLAPANPPGLEIPKSNNCLTNIFMPSRGKLTALSITDRKAQRPPGMIFYPHKDFHPNYSATPLPHFIRTMGCVSSTVFDGPFLLAAGISPGGVPVAYGVTSKRPLFAFNNQAIASTHVAPSVPVIEPGQTGVLHTCFYLADLSDYSDMMDESGIVKLLEQAELSELSELSRRTDSLHGSGNSASDWVNPVQRIQQLSVFTD